MAICHIIVHFSTSRTLDAWRGMWISVRSKDAQKQLARTSLNMEQIKIWNQLADVGGREGETILVTERLIIHSSGESRGKHGAVISITTLKGDRIISFWRKALPV